jgi:hypothetical protein
MVGQAAGLAGGSLGAMGAFMAGPWGLALTAGVALLATFIPKLFQTGDSVGTLVEKLKEHAEKAKLSAQADEIWSHSLDGLIDRHKKLNEQLQERLKNQTEINAQELATARHNQLAAQSAVTRLESDPNATAADIQKAQQTLTAANRDFTNAQVLAGRELGEAVADITARAKLWADTQANIILAIQRTHPELTERAPAADLSAAYTTLKKAIDAAAGAGVDFNDTVRETDKLNNQLQHGTITVATYTSHVRDLATALKATADAAKDVAKQNPVQQFKSAVIGAEGTGPNKLGSSAAGFGQFMPDTWRSYFDKLFPDKASLDDASKLAFRNVRSVAEAVIDSATKDYVKVLQGAGQSLTAANLYTVHLLGSRDANRLFAASSGTPTSQVLSGQVLAGNPFLKGTVGEARARIAGRIGDSSSAVSGGAAAIAERQAQLAQQAASREAAYQSELSALETKLLGTQKTKLLSADKQLQLAEEQVNNESDANDKAYAAALKAGRIDAEQAALLTEKNHQVAAARGQRLIEEEAQRKAQLAAALEEQRQQANVAELQDAVQNAKTGSERKDAMLRLLDAETELTRIKLQQTIDATAAGTAEHELAVLKLAQLSDERTRRVANINRDPSAMTPGQNYVREITRTADQLNEDFQHVAIDGLQKMNDEITSAIMGTETLGQAFHNVTNQIISELVRIAVQQLVIKPIASMLFGGGGWNSGGGLGSLLGLFGGGGGGGAAAGGFNIGGGTASFFASNPFGGFRASGGAVAAGLPYMVGENGPEGFVPNQAGHIVPNSQLMRNGMSGHSVVEVHVVPNDERFGAYVARITDPRIASASVRAARGGMQLTQQMLVQRQLHQLG